MGENENVVIKSDDGTVVQVKLVTYLIDKKTNYTYIVYSKGEKADDNSGEIIYISRFIKEKDTLKLQDIDDNQEWLTVQELLKEIANAL